MSATKEYNKTRCIFEIDQVKYSSLSALKAAWSSKCTQLGKRPTTDCKSLRHLPKATADWYVKAAWAVGRGLKNKLFMKENTLESALEGTVVAVGPNNFLKTKRKVSKFKAAHKPVFTIHFVDKSDFTNIRCVPKCLCDQAKPKISVNYKTKTMQYLRKLVQDQIDNFRMCKKTSHGLVQCQLCAKFVQPRMSHVDHGVDELSFATIAETFCANIHAEHNWTYIYKHLQRNRDSQLLFAKRHREQADLKMTCYKCNLEQGRSSSHACFGTTSSARCPKDKI